MKKFILLALLACIFNIQAQTFESFNGLYSQGIVPEEILSPTFTTFEDALEENLSEQDKRLTKKAKRKFVLSSSYYINDLLVSGKIVFNDTVTQYLNKIKDLLLRDYPELRKKIRIYTYKTPIVNAFATNEGALFVTTGLLARLTTEAQLASVISHEISHYVKKHPINSAVVKADLEKNNRSFKKSSMVNQFKVLASKSKEAELEADDHGYNYFHTTSYSANAPEQSFTILDNSNKPFNVEGSLSIKEYYNFDTPLPEKVFPVATFEKIDEDQKGLTEEEKKEIEENNLLFSSHPAIGERIKNAKLKSRNHQGDKDFIISEPWFILCKRIARIVNVTEALNIQAYDQAFYYCYLLEKEFGAKEFVMKLKLRSLYEMAKYRNNGHDTPDTTFGFNYRNLSPIDAYILAYKYVEKYENKLGEDTYSEGVKKDILAELSSLSAEEDKTKVFRTTYDQLKSKNVIAKNSKNKQYNFNYLSSQYKFMINGEYKYQRKGRKRFFKHFYNTGKPIENIVAIDPIWNSTDTRKGIHLIGSEKQGKAFEASLLENASMTGVNLNLYSSHNLAKGDVDRFNDRVFLIDYVSNLSDGSGLSLVYHNIEEVNRIMKKNNAKHIALMGLSTVLYKRSAFYYFQAILATATIFASPGGIAMLFDQDYESHLFFSLYNVENNTTDFADLRVFKVNSSQLIVNSYFYEYFKMLGKSKKIRKQNK